MVVPKPTNYFHQVPKKVIDVGIFFKGKDYSLLEAFSPVIAPIKLPKIPSAKLLKNKEM
jgi:hypothetical protein